MRNAIKNALFPFRYGRSAQSVQEDRAFTGNCLVRQHTGDGHFVGRCYHSTYANVCPVHGDVSAWLPGDYGDWPRDYELDA